MYKFANALITAGDSASAASAVNWLFNHDIDPSAGRFPQNAFVNGTPFRNAVQMDEQAMPIVLAYRWPSGLQSAVAANSENRELHLRRRALDRAGALGGNERLLALDDRRGNRRSGRRCPDRSREQRSRRRGELAERGR